MGRQRHLGRAPIHEALIDIQFNPVAGVDVGAIAAEFSGDQPASVFDVWQTMFEMKVEADAAPRTSHSADAIGKRIDLPEKHQVVQFRNSGFTFSRLAPYDSWEEMTDAALRAWWFYADRLGPEQINRIAVRYVNILQLPLPLDRFERYLTSPPVVPEEMPQGIVSFLTRVVCPRGEDVAIVTQSLEGEVDGGKAVKVILDIDVSHQCKLDRDNFVAVEAILDRLRAFKNDAFFAFLTNEALEMYE